MNCRVFLWGTSTMLWYVAVIAVLNIGLGYAYGSLADRNAATPVVDDKAEHDVESE